jgi:hypothetical protein
MSDLYSTRMYASEHFLDGGIVRGANPRYDCKMSLLCSADKESIYKPGSGGVRAWFSEAGDIAGVVSQLYGT